MWKECGDPEGEVEEVDERNEVEERASRSEAGRRSRGGALGDEDADDDDDENIVSLEPPLVGVAWRDDRCVCDFITGRLDSDSSTEERRLGVACSPLLALPSSLVLL